jgi:Family of unknown function (DUF6481)
MPTLRRPPKATPSQAHKNASFSDRLNAAAAAKKAALERFHTRPGPDDPAVREQQAARKAISDAREVRVAERQAAREAEAAHQAVEQAAKAAEQAAREAEERRLTAETAARAVALEAERKAARDARYAARKARR